MRLMTLGLLVIAPWPNGLNAPVFCGALFVFSFLLLLDGFGSSKSAGVLAPPWFKGAAACFVAVLFWAFLQALPIWPAKIAHPVWAALERSHAPISASPGLTVDAAMLLAVYGAIFLYTAKKGTDRRFARHVLVAIGAASTFSALAGLVLLSSGDVSLIGTAKRVYRGRLTGPFVNPNLFAFYLTLGIVALMAFAAPSKGSPGGGWRGAVRRAESFLRKKAFAAAGLVLTASALLLTASRGGVFAGLVGPGALGAVSAFAAARSRESVARPVVAGLVAAILVAATSGAGIEKRLYNSAFASEGRETVNRLSVSMIEDRVLIGHGLGAFQDALPAYYGEDVIGLKKPFLYAHNLYAEALSGLGAPVAILLFLVVSAVIAQCVAGALQRRSKGRVYPSVAVASAVALAIHGLVDDPLSIPAIGVSFSSILGVGYAQSVGARRGAAQ